jgi:ATP-dependent DNA helicase RecG
MRRNELKKLNSTSRKRIAGGLLDTFDKSLPFELTAGQVAVCKEIESDLAQPHPMHRLLQGEVGSGKTIVALRAMLAVVDSGGQGHFLLQQKYLLRSICEPSNDNLVLWHKAECWVVPIKVRKSL